MSLNLLPACKRWLSHIRRFSRELVGRPLHDYQLAPAQAIIQSVLHKKGLEIAVLFPRQSGKNETQAHVEAYLLNLYQRTPGAMIVKAQPTYLPQAANAQDRLKVVLANGLNRGRWRPRHTHQIMLGQAGITFLSASGGAQVVGASATLLLQVDEAQDISEAVWDRQFAPMAASANTTTVYWGTAWDSHTLLAKTIRRLRALEQQDHQQRVFTVSPEEVNRVNPAYGQFVFREIARLGRQHATIRSQYFNEEIDSDVGLFSTARRALMQGTHRRQESPDEGKLYALLLDVAGESQAPSNGPPGDWSTGLAQLNPQQDRTALTVVEVDLSTLKDTVIAAPTYRAVYRQLWAGAPHTTLYASLRGLALHWRARYVVVDATGIGHGLASFLKRALPTGTVIPINFNTATKSELGWKFTALCDALRWQDYAPTSYDTDALTFWKELDYCQYQVRPGPKKTMRWGVPDGARDPDGQPVHDDTVISAALVTVLDDQVWHIDTGPTTIIWSKDPLEAMSRGY